MSQRRVTISVPDEVADKATRAVEAGDVDSVSAYFANLAEREPDWVQARAALDEMVGEAGCISEADIAWARELLGIATDSGQDVA